MIAHYARISQPDKKGVPEMHKILKVLEERRERREKSAVRGHMTRRLLSLIAKVSEDFLTLIVTIDS